MANVLNNEEQYLFSLNDVRMLMMEAWIFGESKAGAHYAVREAWLDKRLEQVNPTQNVDLLKQALKYANDFSIQHSGITKDFYIVTTLECVNHQKKKGNLLLQINGNWKWQRTKDGAGWTQVKEPTITQIT